MKIKILAAVAFLAAIVAANYVTTAYGVIPVGFGLVATAGTLFAGATFALRDVLHDQRRPWVVVVLIVLGAVLSFAMSAPFIALASGAAFLVSELTDMAVYAPLRRRGLYRAVVASNVVGAFIDTVLFLAIAGFPVWQSLPGQMVGKLAMTLLAVAVLGGWRAVFRQSVHT